MSKIAKVETVTIILAVLSLWPKILHLQHPAFDLLLYLFLGLMIVIAVRRLRMVRRAFEEKDE